MSDTQRMGSSASSHEVPDEHEGGEETRGPGVHPVRLMADTRWSMTINFAVTVTCGGPAIWPLDTERALTMSVIMSSLHCTLF